MSRELVHRDATGCATVRVAPAAVELARWSAYTIAGLLFAGAGTLAWRRSAQALPQPLDWPALVSAAAIAAGAAGVARLLLGWPAPGGSSQRAGLAFHGVVSSSLAVWGLALGLDSANVAGVLGAWAVLAGEEAWAWWSGLLPGRKQDDPRQDRRVQDAADEDSPSSAAPLHDRIPCPTPPQSEDVLQEFVRSRQPNGGELLTGWMRVGLASRQRSTAVHLAFCPPFARTPAIRVIQRDGPPARIKESQVLPFGARLDVKVSQVVEIDTNLLLEIVVRADMTADLPESAANSQAGTLA